MSTITGSDRKTIRKYLKEAEGRPEAGPRLAAPRKLDPFKPLLAERLKAGEWKLAMAPFASAVGHSLTCPGPGVMFAIAPDLLN